MTTDAVGPVRAVIFDLYGTLIEIERPLFQRRLRRLLEVDRRSWTDYVLGSLLVTPFASREAFVDDLLTTFAADRDPAIRKAALELLDDELASARTLPGVRPLLAFLQRRGLRLGLLSNLASPFRQPAVDLGLSDFFDVTAFSCERRLAKPDPQIYLDVCAELTAEPGEVLMVGDSMRNDVRAPRRLGMRSLWVSASRSAKNALPVAAVGRLSWDDDPRPLVRVGQRLPLGERGVTVTDLESVADEAQGRYNLVTVAEAEDDEGRSRRVYLKRYLLPESAHVEEFTRSLLAVVGVEAPQAGVLSGPEPILWSAEAPGEEVETLPLTPDLAFDIARHGAVAFLFANADYRPRNAFLVDDGESTRLVMVDYEHCLFNLALDVTGVADPTDPRPLEALGADELARRVRKRVISPRTCRRNYREFFGARGTEPQLVAAFREGWCELTRTAQRRRSDLATLLNDRIRTAPYLVIGTRAYRRAMLSLDVEDVLSRLTLDPDGVLDGWMQPVLGA